MGTWRTSLAATFVLTISVVCGASTLRAADKPTSAVGVRVRPAIYTRSIDATRTPSPMKLVDAAPSKAVVSTVGWRHRYARRYGYGPACGPYGCWAGYASPRAAYYRSFYGVYPFYPSYGPAFYGVGYAPRYYGASYAPVYPPAYYAGYRGRYPVGWSGCCYW